MTALIYKYCYETEAEARIRGDIFKARMGPEWTLVVHENLGWHYRLRTDTLSLSEYGGRGPNRDQRTYSVLVGNGSSGKGHWTPQRNEPCYDPWEALKQAISAARAVTDENLAVVQAAEATLAASERYHQGHVAGMTH